jgi:hypothetical protein
LVWEVDVQYVVDWLLSLDDKTYGLVMAALQILSSEGPGLGRPLVDSVTVSRHKNMKELRPGSSGRNAIRVLFAFDPSRTAVLLVAGNKRDRWASWYREAIPNADRIFDEHLITLRTCGE